MSVMLDDDTTTVVLHVLDFDVPCGNGGDHKAEVALRCRRCGTCSLLCRPHLAVVRRECESLDRATRVIGCRVCRAGSRDLDTAFEMVPL